MSQEIELCINTLYAKHGTITPDIVVEEAKNPTSPLHGEFEWDLGKAAMQTWRETARRIIRSVTIQITTVSETLACPRYVRTPYAHASEQSYSDVAQIKPDKDRAAEAMRYEMERLESIVQRIRLIAAALDLVEDVDAIAKVASRITRKVNYTIARPPASVNVERVAV